MTRLYSVFASIIVSVIIIAASPPVMAQTNGSQGGVDLADFDRLFPELPKVEVNVRGSLLRLVVEAARADDPALSNVLSRLRAVQVRTYDMPLEGRSAVEREAGRLSSELDRGGWERVVRVRDGGDNVDIFMSETNDIISGLIVMVLNNDEATFVNIVGEIDPAEVGMIGRRFNIGSISNGIPNESDSSQ